MNELRKRLADVMARVEKTAARSGTDPRKIKLVGVSKTHSAGVLREAIEAGVTALGENKVQEAEGKIYELGRRAAEWHLIGHLQSNKARKAVQLFDVIHSVDSVELARRLQRICQEEDRALLPIYVQIDLAGEQTKSGISESDLASLVDYLNSCQRLRFDGLMVLPPFFDQPEDSRPFFRRLREIRDRLAAANAFRDGAGGLSMGMSHDFEVAIEEGSTVVRVGTAIFGERQRHESAI